MFTRSWISRLFTTHVPRTRRKAPARFRPCLESLEDRLAPATFDVAAGDVGGLVAAIKAANDESLNPGPDTINLTRSTYLFTAANNNWYGPNALPAISSTITINGNGATLLRDPSLPDDTSHDFRFFYVSGGMQGQLSLGKLTLENLTLTGGLAKGGDGTGGGGGGMGAGGAIFNQGTLVLNGVTMTDNIARGGSGSRGTGGGGGGMGSDALGGGGGGG